MRALLVIGLVACGPGLSDIPTPLPPNVNSVCARGEACGFVPSDGIDACVACVESVADKWNEEAREAWGDSPPPIELVSCEALEAEARRVQLVECVAERWWGP